MSEDNVKIIITFPSLDKTVVTDSDSLEALLKATKLKATKKKLTGQEIIKELQKIKAQQEEKNVRQRKR